MTVVVVQPQVLKLKVDFDFPLAISQGDFLDMMNFDLLDSSLFIDSENGL